MTQPNTRAGGDQTAAQTSPERIAVSIAEAADRLGLTSEAVRMRLKRGTLAGGKVDGRWVVYLDATEHVVAGDHTTDQTPPERPTEPQPSAATERDQTATIAVYEQLVASQREEIGFLRAQLEQARRDQAAERERFDVIHREALLRIEALTDGVPGSDERPSGRNTPVSDPAGRSEETPMPVGEAIHDTLTDQRSHLWRWLDRLRGRG